MSFSDFKKTHPESGEDIKMMALRMRRKVDLAVAMAMVDRFIKGENQYFKRKAEMVEAIDEFIDGQQLTSSPQEVVRGRSKHGEHLSRSVNTSVYENR